MMISRALVKQGYSTFSLEILEYCEASKAVSIEQHYLDHLKPQYNILKEAGSSLGFKHSTEAKSKIKTKCLEHLKILNANPKFKASRLEQLKNLNASKKLKVEVFDTALFFFKIKALMKLQFSLQQVKLLVLLNVLIVQSQ